MPPLSSLLGLIFYALPIYIFIVGPITRQLFPQKPLPRLFNPDNTPLLNDTILSLDDGITPTCPEDNYKIHILQRDPLVIYIEDFLTHDEADHLVELGSKNYTPSTIYNGQITTHNPQTRLSDRALLPRDNAVRCLENRAKSFQGWNPDLWIERMWTQRYNVSGHYAHHYDWAGSVARGGDRLSTFMVYLGDDCVGGGTNFPRLRRPGDRSWCRFLESGKEGVTFRVVKGNAVFWENLRPDGTGYRETWHGAFPVTKGEKVGLNIWSWWQPSSR
ncbi:hypothetical protein BDV25DRAFT_132993 [Aspergillus avenaceus]|uniref:Prolyl 4-hydroxylase alpha subunit domain-containing protein n=1 Tax=Aspergillus avenaceus TaxID=36643 RepID=A0A5N6TJ38_ASPAV|nr:hypothetical protein BDV25DRAFT_132993 [Aspergillus avenaceus]